MASGKVIRVNSAEVATYTTTAPVAGSTWTHVPVIEAPIPDKIVERDEALEGNSRGTDSMVYPTVQKGDYSFTTRIYTGTKGFDGAGGDSDPTTCYAHVLLESYFGTADYATFTGTTVDAASGAGYSAALKAVDASNIRVGDAILVGGSSGSPVAEVRFVTAKSINDLTLNADLTNSNNYASGATIYGAFMFRGTLGNKAEYHYLNVEEDGRSVLLGPGRVTGLQVQGLASGQGARYAFKFEGNDWAAGVTPDTFTPNAFTGSPIVTKGGTIYVGTTATSVAECSVDFGIGHEWKPDVTATNGRGGVELTNLGSPRITFKEYQVSQRETDWAAQNGVTLMGSFSVGTTKAAMARGSIAFFCPNAQLVTKRSKLNGQTGLETTFEARDPTSAQVTAGFTKPIYYAVFGGV